MDNHCFIIHFYNPNIKTNRLFKKNFQKSLKIIVNMPFTRKEISLESAPSFPVHWNLVEAFKGTSWSFKMLSINKFRPFPIKIALICDLVVISIPLSEEEFRFISFSYNAYFIGFYCIYNFIPSGKFDVFNWFRFPNSALFIWYHNSGDGSSRTLLEVRQSNVTLVPSRTSSRPSSFSSSNPIYLPSCMMQKWITF